MANKPLVIYHDPCDDGFASAFIAWNKFGDEAEYHGRNYDTQIHTLPSVVERDVYLIDFSFDADTMDMLFRNANRVVWLDHHKTAFDTYCGVDYLESKQTKYHIAHDNRYIMLDTMRSGCVLAHEYFYPNDSIRKMFLHIDDNDRWIHGIHGTREFTEALRTYPREFNVWHDIYVALRDENAYANFVNSGALLLKRTSMICAEIVESSTTAVEIDGILGLSCNAPSHFASEIGALLAAKSGTFGMTWSQRDSEKVNCSLRSRDAFDVSRLAKLFGGGGHRNAAGFSTTPLNLQHMIQGTK